MFKKSKKKENEKGKPGEVEKKQKAQAPPPPNYLRLTPDHNLTLSKESLRGSSPNRGPLPSLPRPTPDLYATTSQHLVTYSQWDQETEGYSNDADGLIQPNFQSSPSTNGNSLDIIGIPQRKISKSRTKNAEDLTEVEIESLSELLQRTALSLDDAIEADYAEIKVENEKIKWYHGSESRGSAENALSKEGHELGLFMVRDSSLETGDFVLSVCYKNRKFRHYEIKHHGGIRYSVGKGRICDGLDGLIAYYRSSEGGLGYQLTKFVAGSPPPNYSRNKGHTNVLHRAAMDGFSDSAKTILAHRLAPDVNAKDQTGSTALHYASKNGMRSLVIMLLEAGANVIDVNRHGFTALHLAAQNGHTDVIKQLIVTGLADTQDKHAETGNVALHEAAKRGHLASVKMLLKLQAAAWSRNKENVTSYEMATQNGHIEIIKALSEHVPREASSQRSKWLHEHNDRQKAIAELERYGMKDGTFLVRRSSKKNDCYVLVLAFGLHPYHYEIQPVSVLSDVSFYRIGEGPYLFSLEHLVDYYCVRPDGLQCKLVNAVTPAGQLYPIPCGGAGGSSVGSNVSRSTSSHSTVSSANKSRKHESRAKHKHQKPPAAKEPLKLEMTSIAIGHELGQGEFGSVYAGVWHTTNPGGTMVHKYKVAIKTLKHGNSETIRNFLKEAKVMVELDHPHVIRLIGVCSGPPIMLVQELADLGSMLDFLLDYRDHISIEHDLYLWAAQIASGMQYLEEKGVVHRDLAARNVMLLNKHHAKVGDFGLSRDVNSDYKVYQASAGGRWPIKWYAPECINFGNFSSASDVWSYGITLWEMFSFGESPYGPMEGDEVIAHLEKGLRLLSPELCPPPVYCLMVQCWEYRAKDRPTFAQLTKHFSDSIFTMPDWSGMMNGFLVLTPF